MKNRLEKIQEKPLGPPLYVRWLKVVAEPARQRAGGAPLLSKFGNLSSQEVLVVT